MNVIDVTHDNFEQEVLNSKKPVITLFWADWCESCKVISPIIQELGHELKNAKVTRLNVDSTRQISMKYGVSAIPTIILFFNGEVKDRQIGFIKKESLLSKIDILIDMYKKEN